MCSTSPRTSRPVLLCRLTSTGLMPQAPAPEPKPAKPKLRKQTASSRHGDLAEPIATADEEGGGERNQPRERAAERHVGKRQRRAIARLVVDRHDLHGAEVIKQADRRVQAADD